MVYLTKLCSKLKYNDEFQDAYLLGPCLRQGLHKILDLMQTHYLIELCIQDQSISVRRMRNHFLVNYYGDQQQQQEENERYISLSTYYRTLIRNNMSRRLFRRDDFEGFIYLERISHINPLNFVDVDETKNNPESFQTPNNSWVG